VDETSWSRAKSVWIVGGTTFLLGLPSALAQGGSTFLTEEVSLFGVTGFFGIMDYIWGNVSLALGALLISVFVGWVWGTGQAVEELQQGSGNFFTGTTVTVWTAFLKYICPVVIAIIFLQATGLLQ
jgi:NSS family neurotransmitter:Na+ symporter